MTIRQVQLIKGELNNKVRQLEKYEKENGLPNFVVTCIIRAKDNLKTAYYELDSLIDEIREEQGIEEELLYEKY